MQRGVEGGDHLSIALEELGDYVIVTAPRSFSPIFGGHFYKAIGIIAIRSSVMGAVSTYEDTP
jgi:hypothetical protein